MIKLRQLIRENDAENIDIDRLFDNEDYRERAAEELGYNTDFTKVFWSQHYLPTLYHCTTKENYERIKVEGLKMKKERRGATSGNSRVGNAVFTTAESEEVSFFKSYYGPVVIAINTTKMKADGLMPHVEKEPDWDKAEMIAFILRKIGQEDAEAARFVDSSDQNTQGTVILYSDIPLQYLSLVEYD